MTIPDRYEIRQDDDGRQRLYDTIGNRYVAIICGNCETHNRRYREWIEWSTAWKAQQAPLSQMAISG